MCICDKWRRGWYINVLPSQTFRIRYRSAMHLFVLYSAESFTKHASLLLWVSVCQAWVSEYGLKPNQQCQSAEERNWLLHIKDQSYHNWHKKVINKSLKSGRVHAAGNVSCIAANQFHEPGLGLRPGLYTGFVSDHSTFLPFVCQKRPPALKRCMWW